MTARAVAVLFVALLAGCARATPAPRAPVVAAPTPVAESDDTDRADGALDAARAALAAASSADETESTVGDEGPGFSPEAIHEARIALAREALVEDNAAKQRVDIEEQLQRELEQLMEEKDRTAKSRRHHARAHR